VFGAPIFCGTATVSIPDQPLPGHLSASSSEHQTGSAPCSSSLAQILHLTPTQQKIVWAGIACLGLLACVVPWTQTVSGMNGIDVARVFIPMAVVVCATVAGVLLTGAQSRKTS
jgi:hypothetical protein